MESKIEHSGGGVVMLIPNTSTTQKIKKIFLVKISIKMLKKIVKVFGSQKSKLTALEQVFRTANIINPPSRMRNKRSENFKSTNLNPINILLIVT